MKKFLNSADTYLTDALAGFAAAHPDLAVDLENRVVTRARGAVPGKVGLVSGGGSGHEPLHTGFVGEGMLDAACPGEVFTSPVPDQVVAAVRAADSGAGVVLVVKNYTGDVMNFDLAAELAGDEGVRVETVLVDDDVAVQDSTFTAGRRGTGATLLVEKIAGAAAVRGDSLEAVAEVGRRVNAASRSFAVALTAGTTPASGRPGFDLPADEIEVGVGIHGEPGRRRERLRPAREIVADMVEAILQDRAPAAGEEVIALVNGLGGTPLSELYLVYGEVARLLGERGVRISRSLVGDYVTSLDMAGCSITLCGADPEMLALWDAPVSTPGLRWGM
ncbi:dihydroxyacetone kinase subunit DhaK [Streptomonospora nanhaiensis]|uniref:phosphoenolpyruvate--glycerone phosphotransferase n=1 Tax=Streptomonospora nanhaiensis TaxID=1323731 RepID=A0A853BLR0_9ACTN|nr:dihydroxyacetone kinase subunit DhaK [Streptomonospora nanhaiensis]MBV2363276.1 dihydroxyacetone kinase subunit DhaK [Streptomonospora nanhaiensis]MBX9389902.1 dihydroxyacetone kinase subunit DhaK [Streptomonospora nanhaiensis]NYI95634.1 dihydroxyacetone kinase-like protein [Streptomonospora nanhaiensis]